MSIYGAYEAERYVPESAGSSGRTPFERDRARVLHSSALRRLAAKTQVLGPRADDFIRTRLTHSLEVAQVGRSLASIFGAEADVVEAACLCHDLGHPPYGHNGEAALARAAADIGGFEGNAQTLRILTRLEPKRLAGDRPAGLNLTRATLDATIKYPWGYYDRPNPASGKFNVYEDDYPVFEWIRARGEEGKAFEADIMDLADDIGYSVHDVEDAIARGAFRPEALANRDERARILTAISEWYGIDGDGLDAADAAYTRLLADEAWPEGFDGSFRALAAMKDLTSDLIGRFVSAVTEATRAKYGPGALGRYGAEIVVPDETRAEILVLKGIAVTYVMIPREAEVEPAYQQSVLLNLVDALEERPDSLLQPYRGMWEHASGDGERKRVIIDQVAALTDTSADRMHATLCGMIR